MPYVMVPVPEEHVEEVMELVLKARARAAIKPWDQESISALFADIDELGRALLSYVSRATSAGKDLTDADLAVMMQLSGRETNALIRELASAAKRRKHPTLIAHRKASETLPNGRTVDKRVIAMDADVAELVAAAEQLELGGAPRSESAESA